MSTSALVIPRLRRGLWLAWLGVAACNQVLGIEDAHVDATIRAAAGGGMQGGSEGDEAGSGGAAQGGSGGVGKGGAAMVAQGGSAHDHGASGGAVSSQSGGSSALGEAGSGADAGAGGVPGTPVSLCQQYCDTVTKHCTGDALQYKDLDQCLEVCRSFPEGVVGGADGDTVACRLKYAGKARYAGGSELAAYCRQGGPGGDGRCGSNCDGLCDITQATCSQGETAPYYFASREACKSTCATLPDVPFVYGNSASVDGNSLQCRLFHVMSAAMADADEHCAHVMGVTLCEAPGQALP